jgi:hypothetical protein
MSTYKAKTTQTNTTIFDFIGNIADEQQRQDSLVAIEMMQEITGEQPKVWGPSIVGFGKYHYKYASGHEGDTARMAFAPRKGQMTFYLLPGLSESHDCQVLLAKLGKHKLGKGCLYIKRLSDVDLTVLREILELSLKVLMHSGFSQ